MKLVTIIGEALAREALKKLLAEVGAHGYTLFTVEGDGSQGRRVADIQEFANIQIEVIVPPAVAEKILTRLEQEFFDKFAMVAYETDIRVLRREKF
jgi:nitrogen regulatory protein P-II 2